MTVIAFDGKTLAVDKQASLGNTVLTTTKLIVRKGIAYAIAGSLSRGLAIVDWLDDEWSPLDSFPYGTDDDYANVYRVKDGKLSAFENHPSAVTYEDQYLAFGSGRDAAMGAMLAKADAYRAVEIACEVDTSCGRGIDFFIVNNTNNP